jgi:tetrahydromethanopterin S-methyltransferase subunit G
MDAVRESWTDARLDDFAQNTDRRFDSVERRMEVGFAEMRGRFDAMDARFDSMDARFDSMNARFDSMNARFDSLQRTLLQFCGGFLVALIGLLATLIATQL